jgi:type I restriction enzyme S subunit
VSDLSFGWALAKMGDLAHWGSGGTPKSDVAEYYGGNIPWVITADLTDGPVRTSTRTITELGLAKSSAKLVPSGTILVAMYGASIGRVGIASMPLATNQAIANAQVYDQVVMPTYLLYYLLSQRSALVRAGKGAAQPNIGQGTLKDWPIPVAPLPEQARIVAAIEEQFSRLDAGVAALDRVRQNLKRIRGQGVSSLFDPLWPRVPLADVLTLISDCPHRTPKYTDGEGYPALRPRDVVGGELRLETSARVSTQEYRLQTARHTPEAGDVVYSRELSYGWAVELPKEPPICLSQGMVILRTTELLPGFLTHFLNSYEGRQQADRAATGTAHPHINLHDIKQYRVPLAPLTDQRRVLALASELLNECDRTSQSMTVAMARAAALRSAILSHAFSGKLVQQDPTDEPASVSIERIAAKRESFNGQRPAQARKLRAQLEKVNA